MRIGHIIILVLATLLLAVSVIVAQLAFHGERTLMSFAYTRRLLQETLAPIRDPEIHQETVEGAFALVSRELTSGVPRELRPYIVQAAVRGFDPEWVEGTAERMLYSVQQVINGRESSLRLPISIAAFKNEFLQIARRELPSEYFPEINRELEAIPTSIDLADEIDQSTVRRVVSFGRSARVVSFLLQYVVPAVFILLCFVPRRVGTGIAATGIGLLLGGIAVILGSTFGVTTARIAARSAAAAALPRFARWVADGVGAASAQVAGDALTVAVIVAVCGVAFTALGVFLVASGKDVQIRFHA